MENEENKSLKWKTTSTPCGSTKNNDKESSPGLSSIANSITSVAIGDSIEILSDAGEDRENSSDKWEDASDSSSDEELTQKSKEKDSPEVGIPRKRSHFSLSSSAASGSKSQRSNQPHESIKPPKKILHRDMLLEYLSTENKDIPIQNEETLNDDPNESLFDNSLKCVPIPNRVKWPKSLISLKPRDEKSLLHQIFFKPKATGAIVAEVIRHYDHNQTEAIIQILQFFVDLSGFKNTQIAPHFDIKNKNNICTLVEKLCTELVEPESRETGKYIFTKYTQFQKVVDTLLTIFFSNLIMRAYNKGILFDGVFLPNLLKFLDKMSLTAFRPFRTTGVILAVKLQTTFVDLWKHITAENQASSSLSSRSLIRTKIITIRMIQDSIDALFLIYRRNCTFSDQTCYVLKIKCAHEALNWVKFNPEIFLMGRDILTRLMSQLIDRNPMVRSTVLCVFAKFLDDAEICKVLSLKIDYFLQHISHHIIDPNPKIVIKAIVFFTKALKIFFKSITSQQFNMVINRIFEKNLPVAKAAGKFIAQHFIIQKLEDFDILIRMTKLVFEKVDFSKRLPFFIEAVIDFAPALSNFRVIFHILLNPDINIKVRLKLMQVAHEVIKFTLTKEFTMSRQKFEKDINQHPEKHIEVASYIFSNFEKTILTFKENEKFFGLFTDILTFINYEVCIKDSDVKNYTNACLILQNEFHSCENKSSLSNICTFQSNIYKLNKKKKAENTKIAFIKKYVDNTKEGLKNLSRKSLDLKNIAATVMRLSVIFSKFDLQSYIQWNEIFDVWDYKYIEVLEHLVVCCKWYLVWSFRQLITEISPVENEDSGSDETANVFRVYSYCKSYFYGCLDILKYVPTKNKLFLVYDSFCDLYMIMGRELRENAKLSHFLIRIEEEPPMNILFSFVANHIIENEALELFERQNYLRHAVHLFCLEVAPIQYFARLLRIYEKHYDDYKPIFHDFLTQMSYLTPSQPALIADTLTTEYSTLLQRFKQVKIDDDSTKHLKLLSKKLCHTINYDTEVRTTKDDILKLMMFLIKFAKANQRSLPFFYFATDFAKHLPEDFKPQVYECFKTTVAPQHAKNVYVLQFAESLKPQKQ